MKIHDLMSLLRTYYPSIKDRDYSFNGLSCECSFCLKGRLKERESACDMTCSLRKVGI